MKNKLIAYCGLDCETCADCPEKPSCDKLQPFRSNAAAMANLGI